MDAWDSIFIWIGKDANKEEITSANKIAIEYLTTDPSHRETDIPIFKIKEGFEPPNFTAFFGIWDQNLSKAKKNYEELKAELHSKNDQVFYQEISQEKSKDSLNGMKPSDFVKYTYAELCRPVERLPENVIAEFREVQLKNL